MQKHPIILDYKLAAEAISSNSFTVIHQKKQNNSWLSVQNGGFKFIELCHENVSARLFIW